MTAATIFFRVAAALAADQAAEPPTTYIMSYPSHLRTCCTCFPSACLLDPIDPILLLRLAASAACGLQEATL